MKRNKNRGIENLKSKYGLMFITPWLIGTIMFVIVPLFQSIFYSFNEVTIVPGDIELEYSGLGNYKEILFSDPNYMDWIKQSITSFLYSLPIILLVSLVLAILLNQNFKGRVIFRALYFMPVIIATGEVIKLIFATTQKSVTDIGVSASFSSDMLSVDDLATWLNLTPAISDYITNIMGKIFDLLWNCGIQIILFLAGLQSIPRTLYEASHVEGATKWEEFWFITFPMLSRVTLLVSVFTMVELITDQKTSVIKDIYAKIRSGIYDESSAMIWFYFIVVGCLMGLLVFLYNRLLMRRWDS